MGLSRELMQKLMQGYRLSAASGTPSQSPETSEASPGTVRTGDNSPGNGDVGKGLHSQSDILGSGIASSGARPGDSAAFPSVFDKAELQWLPPDQIEPHPFQPRTPEEQATVETLRESIASCGQIVPAVVRRMKEGSGRPYRLIEGHRRWEAVRQLNRSLLCYVVECTPFEDAMFLLAANLNRQELRYLPLSRAMRQVVELGVPQKELASVIGWDPAAVSRCLRLSRLPAATLEWLNRQQWSYRKINLALDTCLRHGGEVEQLSPEELKQALRQAHEEREGKARRHFRFSILLPQREAVTSVEDYEREALKVYYAGCAAGVRELWKTVSPGESLPAENQLEAVLSPAVEVLRQMNPETGWTPEMVWEKFMECWIRSTSRQVESLPEVNHRTDEVAEELPEPVARPD